MLLKEPFTISSRLMPAVKVGDATISVSRNEHRARDGRFEFKMIIDFADGTEFECDDLTSPWASIQSAMESYLSFLSAGGEAYGYQLRTGRSSDNIDLFPHNVTEWAYQNSDELSTLSMDMEEGKFIDE